MLDWDLNVLIGLLNCTLAVCMIPPTYDVTHLYSGYIRSGKHEKGISVVNRMYENKIQFALLVRILKGNKILQN